ncbi:MAG: hypothetical protein MI920_39110 [Kiloniellales bacterium]|nr:hypothetical protein [Kiloniellales bacterium]
MAQEFAMTLCNITDDRVTWNVTPAGGETTETLQASRQFGTILVPFAEKYHITAGKEETTSDSPSVAAVYTGTTIVICSPA